ncbi:MAG TPA: hypothetical protein VGK99_12665 [Acidobacteriota bacterium]
MIPEISPRHAAAAAYAAAAFNLIAAAAMLVLLRPGMPLEGSLLADRMEFVHAHRIIWWTGWLIWHAAAVSLIAFYVGFAAVAARHTPLLSVLAILCAVAGLAADLAAEAFYMGLAPEIEPQYFPAVERAAGLLTGYAANGLYALAGILLTFGAARELPSPLVWFSIPVWSSALALSATTLAGSARGQFWSTALLMPLFVVWTWLVGRWLSSRAS